MKFPSSTAMLYLAVGCGAGIGALLRFWCGLAITGAGFDPLWTTALVNIAGSFAIMFVASGNWPVSPAGRQFLMGGVCGGFTTFSAMSLDVLMLMLQSRPLPAIFYLVAVIVLSLGAGWMGRMLGRRPQE